jgi:hypothetical protein
MTQTNVPELNIDRPWAACPSMMDSATGHRDQFEIWTQMLLILTRISLVCEVWFCGEGLGQSAPPDADFAPVVEKKSGPRSITPLIVLLLLPAI